MAVINTQYAPAVLATIIGYSSLTATASARIFSGAVFPGSTTLAPTAGLVAQASATVPSSTTISALAHLFGDPNRFPSVNCTFEVDVTAEMRRVIIPYVNCQFEVPVSVIPSARAAETYPLDIIVDIVPPASTSLWQGDLQYELRINGTTIKKVKSFAYSEPKSDVGNSLTIDLADVDDIPAVEAATSFRFRVNNGIEWKTYVDEALINTSNYTLSRSGNAPLTQFQFTNRSAVGIKLTKCPHRDLVIYDPQAVTVSADDFDIVYTEDGTPFITSLVPVGRLTIRELFDRIFVGKLGFLDTETNLPDFPIHRADFTITDTYLSSIAGLIGMFHPLIFEYNSKLWVIDSTNVLPAGFPISTLITVSNSASIRISKNIEKIDAYYLVYSEDGLNYDYFTSRTETKFTENGSVADGNYTKTEITKTILEYRRFERPTVIIKSDISRERRETVNDAGDLVGRSLEDRLYDTQGRETSSFTSEDAMVPTLPDGTLVLTPIHEIRKQIEYGQDPFQPSRQVQKNIWTDIRGLIAIDNDNLFFGEPFKQDYMTAYQAGNLTEEMDTDFGVTKSITETLVPLSNGQSQWEVTTHDYLLNTITKSDSEPRNGDFSINGNTSKQRKLIVPFEGVDLDDENLIIKRLYVDQLPVQYAIALAKRLLYRANIGEAEVSVDYIGTNFYLRRGLPVAVHDLENNVLVNCLVEGFQVTGNQTSLMTSIEGIKIG